jgi:TetR/AcrR family transcriptional regulator, regulator of cefoperazone and chloramphenicol sensitivity
MESNTSQVPLNNEVIERLLDAAEVHFSEKGYQAASIRDLTADANCNVAAVNYHFGNKENLYRQVFLRRCTALRDIRLKSIEKALSEENGKPSLEKLLRLFASAFIEPLVQDSGGRRFLILATREMLNPRLPQDILLNEVINPVTISLEGALMQVCPYLTSSRARLCIHSIIGQLIQVVRMKAMFDAMGQAHHSDLDLTQAVDHIVEFSATAIRSYDTGRAKCARNAQ